MDDKIAQLLLFQVRRKLINLTKDHLVQLEEISERYPIDYINLRKSCLDRTNDSFRELEELVKSLNITIK